MDAPVVTQVDVIAVIVVMLVASAVAYAIGSPVFSHGGPYRGPHFHDYMRVVFRSPLVRGTRGARIERRLRSDRYHRTWAYVGALALSGLSVLCLLGAWRTRDFVVAILAVALIGAALMTVRAVRAGEAHDSNAALVGMFLAGTAIFIALSIPTLMTAMWFAACMLLGVIAVLALGVGRG